MIDVVVSSAAESDYAEALSWYAERSVQAAERFDSELDHVIQMIASDPERFPRCDDPSSLLPDAVLSLSGDPSMRPQIERICREIGYEPPVICTPQELLEINDAN